MLYVISIEKDYNDEVAYKFIESGTESVFTGDTERLKRLKLMHGIEIKNMRIKVKDKGGRNWWDKIICEESVLNSEAEYTVMCNVGKDMFKLVNTTGIISHININQLKKYTKENRIANCYMQNDKLITINDYKINKDTQFEESIYTKYQRYEAISAMVGGKSSFNYIIEGNEVKLVKYTGVNKNVIVPKFVTSIMKHAFFGTKIETLTLETGLKSIGSHAFDNCNLAKVEIPETVEFIGAWAFDSNRRLTDQDGKYREGRITILNNKAVILDRYNNSLY